MLMLITKLQFCAKPTFGRKTCMKREKLSRVACRDWPEIYVSFCSILRYMFNTSVSPFLGSNVRPT